ncbi:hypothetical protein FRB99_002996 [Tulasnella sp. 403]|nr:hypothetical protein FRB99_002996 [Tulasnella sp. 403]
MVRYVKSVKIEYGWKVPNPFKPPDVNNHLGGQYVYITPVYTTKRCEAASSFQAVVTRNEDLCATDLAKGDGKEFFRYIAVYYTFGGNAAITEVWVSTKKDTAEGDGRTENINKGRGGDFVYLCWNYEKQDAHSIATPLLNWFPGWTILRHLLTNNVATAGKVLKDRMGYKAVMSFTDHPFHCVDDSPEDVNEPDIRYVRLGNLVFCHDGGEATSGDNHEDLHDMIQNLLGMSMEDRVEAINARFDLLNVVPIRRCDGEHSTDQILLSLDNRR